jgi:putative ABC transport system substrate-binding protein
LNRRNTLHALAALCAAAASPYLGAQAPGTKRRVAIVASGSLAHQPLASLVEGLRAMGYIEGRDIEFFAPSAMQGYAPLAALAVSAVQRGAEVIVSFGTTATQAARKATASVPIVMVVGSDPVALGLVGNLARPEANVTGLATSNQVLISKRVELLKEIVPRMRRVAVMWNPASSGQQASLRLIEQAATRIDAKIHAVEIKNASDIEAASAPLSKAGVDAIIAVPSTTFLEIGPQLVKLAARLKLPSIYAHADYVRAGGLVSYSPDLNDQLRRAAIYVDRILKGAKPGDLPIEQPTKFELVANRGTAKALGIAFPQSVLVRADEIIG